MNPTKADSREELVSSSGRHHVRAASDPLSVGRGNIITRERFTSFELVAEFKLTPGANSGIKYFVQSNLDPENQTGAGNRSLGSLYDLIPSAASKQSNPVGEWNTARILVQGRHVEHWLNGQKIVEYERGSPAFRAAVAQANSKAFPLSANGRRVTSCCKKTATRFTFGISRSASSRRGEQHLS